MQFKMTTLALCAAGLFALPGIAAASGGPSGPAVTFAVQGNIDEVIVNPYKIAPLTAVIRNGGYELKVEVRIVPKQGRREIKYAVSKRQLKNNAGIPIFGLYPDYLNTVEVKYTRIFNGEEKKFSESYQFYAPPVFTLSNGMPAQKNTMFHTEVVKGSIRSSKTASTSWTTSSRRSLRTAPASPGITPRAAPSNGRSIPRWASSTRPAICAGISSTDSSTIPPPPGRRAS